MRTEAIPANSLRTVDVRKRFWVQFRQQQFLRLTRQEHDLQEDGGVQVAEAAFQA